MDELVVPATRDRGGSHQHRLGLALTFAPPIYGYYVERPRLWGISAAADQNLGGVLM